MRISTPFTQKLGIDLPIVQAPIGEASSPALVAAVSNAGGLGMLSITWRSLERTRESIRQTRELTGKPFGVNLVLDWDPEERLAIALDEGVPFVSFFWGDPAPYVARIHAAGALVAHTVASTSEAKRAAAAGVDVVVAQGWEAGGHVWGEVATLPLIPAVVDAVPGVPVIAAGGISDGRGLAAVLALGASGAWLGTRFLMAAESGAHTDYRDRLIRAAETDTTYGTLFDGGWPDAPLRALRNSTVERWEAAGRPASGARPGEGEIVGKNWLGEPVARYSSDSPLAGATGDIEAMVMYAGQSVGGLNRVQPAAEIVSEIATDAIQAIQSARAAIQE